MRTRARSSLAPLVACPARFPSVPMTATSASSATGTPSPATPPFAEPLAHVRIPGSARTYEVRDVLRGMGLRWDPLSHAWHGTLPGDQGSRLAREYGLKPQLVPTIEAFASEPTSRPPEAAPSPPVGPRPPVRPRTPRDGSRTRAEARLAFPEAEEEEDDPADSRRFSLWEITSGLPDDSREADERREEHYLRDVRSRVKLARAVVSRMPGLAAILRERPDRAARFYARFGITEEMFRCGVAFSEISTDCDPVAESLELHAHAQTEARARGDATLQV
jgi:hypothetical protein